MLCMYIGLLVKIGNGELLLYICCLLKFNNNNNNNKLVSLSDSIIL